MNLKKTCLKVLFPMLLLTAACSPKNAFKFEKQSEFNFLEKRVLVVTLDTELSRDFVISFKNYVSLALKNRGASTANVNLSQIEPIFRIEEYQKLVQNFQPHYELVLRVKEEKAKTFATLSEKVKQLKSCTFDLTVKERSSGAVVGVGSMQFDNIYETEKLTMIRAMTKQILANFQKNNIIK